MEGAERTCFTNSIVEAAGDSRGRDSDVRTSRWYALYVRSRHEKIVESGLRGKDIWRSHRFIARGGRESTGSPKSMCRCFLGTSFVTLTRTLGCQFL